MVDLCRRSRFTECCIILETLNAEMISNGIDKTDRYKRLKEISEYQLLIMNEKDFMKALKKLNNKVYIENQNKLNKK